MARKKKADTPQAVPAEETRPKHIVEAKSYVELRIPYRQHGSFGSFWTETTRHYTKEEALDLSFLIAAEAAKLA